MLAASVPALRRPALTVRPMLASDLDDADRIARVAFGTALGMAAPERFLGDASWVRTRWRADPCGALVVEHDGTVIGSSIANRWGSLGVLGPVTVHPHHWGRTVGRSLTAATLEVFADSGIADVGLFTFADSPKHVALYQRFGFWPRCITAVMRARVPGPPGASPRLLSALSPHEYARALTAIGELTDAIHPGLDLGLEIEAVRAHGFGETVIIDDGDHAVAGVAICHLGANTEAGSARCYVKFGAVAPGDGARRRFMRLLDACFALAAGRGATCLVAGVNAAREAAWRGLRERGFRPHVQGVSMHRPNLPFYSTARAYVIDDWR